MLKNLNPPGKTSLKYGETGDGVFDFVKGKLRKPDAVAPPKTKQEFDEQQVKVEDTSTQEQESDPFTQNVAEGVERRVPLKLAKDRIEQIGNRIPAFDRTRAAPRGRGTAAEPVEITDTEAAPVNNRPPPPPNAELMAALRRRGQQN